MLLSSDSKLSLWHRLWQPFFGLSIYGKFIVVLASFLLGFIVLEVHNIFFVHALKKELLQLVTAADETMISQIFVQINKHLRTGSILVLTLMLLLSLTSFLCIQILVNLLNEMSRKLQILRITGGSSKSCSGITAVPVISRDEIGGLASTLNNLVLDICNLSRFRRTIEADATTSEVYKRLAFVFQEQLHLPSFVIWEISENGEGIKPVYTWPLDMEAETCRMSSSTLCRAKRTGEIISSAGYSGICPVFPLSDVMTHCCVPMMVGGETLGVVQFLFLFVNSDQRQENLDMSLQQAKLYLRETLPVLHAKRLAENLQKMATRDALTGLHNRRFLESSINALVEGVIRRASSMALLMCDMDFFKTVNDTYGHDAGDIVLKGLAHTLRNCCRSSDLVIRYGGEEFLILLMDCNPEKAMEVAEKIRSTVEDQQFRFEGESLRKTVSIGVSLFPGDTSAFWECLKFSDVAMYQAKETGRNRVLRFIPEMWDDVSY